MPNNKGKKLLTGVATIGATALVGHHILEGFGVPHGMAEAVAEMAVGAEAVALSAVATVGTYRDKITGLFSRSK